MTAETHPYRAAATSLRPGEPKNTPYYDDEVLAILAGLPPCQEASGLFHVAIANAAGRVYRRIDLYSALSVLQFSARLNAAGFAVHPKSRAGGPRIYESIFFKPKRLASRSRLASPPEEDAGPVAQLLPRPRRIGGAATDALAAGLVQGATPVAEKPGGLAARKGTEPYPERKAA